MIVGLLTMDLHIPDSNSLKSKRTVIKSIIDRIKNRHNVSVAEVNANNLWQRSMIAVTCVSDEKVMVNRVFEKIRTMVLQNHSVELIDSTIEML